MTKKKALIIAYNDLNNSGVPNVIFQVVSSLYDKYDFDIVVFGDDTFYLKKLQSIGINPKIIRFNSFNKNNKNTGMRYHVFTYPKIMYDQSLEIMSAKHYDLIHSFKEYYSWPFLKAAKKCGIGKRIVHSNIDNSKKSNLKYKLLKIINKSKTLHYSTELVGVSNLCCKNSFGHRNYRVLHNSFDNQNYNDSVMFTGNQDLLALAQIGSLNSNKNQLLSVEIARKLKENDTPFKLYLVGKETEKNYKDKIENLIIDYSLKSEIEIIDKDQDIRKIYEKSKYILIPSKSEGASIVAIEAQACGIPVFASSSLSPDMNIGGITFINKTDSPEIWAKAIIAQNKNEYKRSHYDTSDFSPQTFKRNLLKIYEG